MLVVFGMKNLKFYFSVKNAVELREGNGLLVVIPNKEEKEGVSLY